MGIAQAEDDLRVGVMGGKLLIKGAAWPIDAGAIGAEHLLPIDRFVVGHPVPEGALARIGDHFQHVMAGREAELFQRRLQRKRAGAPETGADNFQ